MVSLKLVLVMVLMSSCCLYASRLPHETSQLLPQRRQTTEGYTNPEYLNEIEDDDVSQALASKWSSKMNSKLQLEFLEAALRKLRDLDAELLMQRVEREQANIPKQRTHKTFK